MPRGRHVQYIPYRLGDEVLLPRIVRLWSARGGTAYGSGLYHYHYYGPVYYCFPGITLGTLGHSRLHGILDPAKHRCTAGPRHGLSSPTLVVVLYSTACTVYCSAWFLFPLARAPLDLPSSRWPAEIASSQARANHTPPLGCCWRVLLLDCGKCLESGRGNSGGRLIPPVLSCCSWSSGLRACTTVRHRRRPLPTGDTVTIPRPARSVHIVHVQGGGTLHVGVSGLFPRCDLPRLPGLSSW